MSSSDDCPDPATLRAYLAGTVEDTLRAEINSHLQQCVICRAVLQAMQVQRTDHDTGEADQLSATSQLTSTRHADFEPTPDPDDELTVIESLLLGAPQNSSAIGRLGKYDILGVLGRGGMGVVLRGYDAELRREVAIKTLNRTLSSSAVAKRRFMREARAAAAINHPHVVTIYSVDQHRNMPFIVMELVRGPTLAEEIRKHGRLDPIRVVRIGAQIAAGLAAAHLQGVIHRDIKPGNVMLENEVDQCKIADFGLARATIDNIELTSRELAVGTPAYMSPEQITEGEVDARSDLFSQGGVMYAMLVGHSPFHGRSALEIIRLVERCSPPDLLALDSGIPEFLRDIVMRLLRRDPDERFQSAAELADTLNRYLSMINQAKSDEQGRIPLSKLPIETSQPGRAKRRTWAVLGLVGLGILAAGIAWAIWGTSTLVPAPNNTAPLAANLTVSQGGNADYTSISEAIRSAGAGTTILVTDDATYVESVRLSKSNVTLRSLHQATIRVPDIDDGEFSHAVEIQDCRNVTLEGFQVISGNQGYALYLHGAVGEICLRHLVISQAPLNGERPTMRFSAHGGRTARPGVLVENCEIFAAKFPCLWLEDHTAPTSIQKCLFLPTETAVGTWGNCGSLEVSGCIFRGGVSGVNVVGQDWAAAESLRVVNNSFDGTHSWLGIHTAVPERVHLEIANNLILDGMDVEIADPLLAALGQRKAFRSNFWQVPAGTPWTPERMGKIAAQLSGDQTHLARDHQQPDYLRPPADSVLVRSGTGGQLPSYVGAIPPAEH